MMNKSLKYVGASFLAMLSLATTASAVTVESADVLPGSFEIEARARNGRTGFEGVLFTPAAPFPGNAATQLNPSGAPAWNFGSNYDFSFTYTMATGTATWSIDFDQNGDFLGSEESASSTTPALAGFGFTYLHVFGQGNANSSVTLNDVTINGATFGPFTSGSGSFSELYTDSSGLFGDITATGSFSFSANGGTDERPRLWVQLSTPGQPQNRVPDTGASITLLGAALAGLAAVRRRFKA